MVPSGPFKYRTRSYFYLVVTLSRHGQGPGGIFSLSKPTIRRYPQLSHIHSLLLLYPSFSFGSSLESLNSRVLAAEKKGSVRETKEKRRRKKNFGSFIVSYTGCKINRWSESGCQRDLSNKFPRTAEYFVTAFKQCPVG